MKAPVKHRSANMRHLAKKVFKSRRKPQNPAPSRKEYEPPMAKCPSCGIPYVYHLGLHGTCAALQTTLTTLRQIRDGRKLPRRRLRQMAGATEASIGTQIRSSLNAAIGYDDEHDQSTW
jgi:hypothetical protein